MSSLEQLLRWGEEHGTTLDKRVEIYEDSITGLSFRSIEDFPAGTKIATSSPKTALSYLNATQNLGYSRHSSSPFPSEFISALEDEFSHIIGNFFLVQQYTMGKDSFWWNYISMLPQPDQPESIPTPMWWSDKDLSFLEGTNAAPAVEKKIDIWRSDYEKGMIELRGRISNADEYTWTLYKWAATMFGTRSFRPSLTTSFSVNSTESMKAAEHVLKDHFSILFPIVDIGNHNGENTVQWCAKSNNVFNLVSKDVTAKGCQIYNFYGDKSNSELLVGYGFTLNRPEADAVNLKVQPPPNYPSKCQTRSSPLTLRCSQTCHIDLQQYRQPEEEWMYSIFRIPRPDALPGFQLFSHGLMDTLSCLVANEREQKFLLDNPGYCLEKDERLFFSSMSRNVIAAYQVLYEKLHHDLEKLRAVSTGLSTPSNPNQILAMEYRNRQALVLEQALVPSSPLLQLFPQNTPCTHPQHCHAFTGASPDTGTMQLLSLECAYNYLNNTYPSIYLPLSNYISDLEEEPNPPRWSILAEEFGNAYWAIFLFIIYSLHKLESSTPPHPQLAKWLSNLDLSYDNVTGVKYGDMQERETISEVVDFVSGLPELNEAFDNQLDKDSIRDFVTRVAFQETVSMRVFDFQTGTFNFEEPAKRVLCIANLERL